MISPHDQHDLSPSNMFASPPAAACGPSVQPLACTSATPALRQRVASGTHPRPATPALPLASLVPPRAAAPTPTPTAATTTRAGCRKT